MEAGRLRETVVFERPVSVPNDFGEEIQTWKPFYQTRAAITQLSSAQLTRAGRPDGTATYQIAIRYYPGLSMPMRILWTNNEMRKLHATSISSNDDVKRRSLEIIAEERSE